MTSRLLCSAMLALAISGCGSCDTPVPPAPPQGSVSLAWSIVDAHGQAVPCEAVGAATVSLTARDVTRVATVTAAFPCTGSPRALLLAPGVYDAQIVLQTADDTPIATAPDPAVFCVRAGQVTTLTPAVFTVRASLVLSFTAPAARSNCAPVENGGAGLTSSTLILQDDRDGPCEPVTWLRARGDTSLGTYTVDCGSPQVASCFETDETLTLPDIAPGTYTVHARGQLNGAPCWGNDDTLVVALGVPTVRTLTLAALANPGCPQVHFTPLDTGHE